MSKCALNRLTTSVSTNVTHVSNEKVLQYITVKSMTQQFNKLPQVLDLQ